MSLRVEGVVVHPHDEGGVGPLRGCGDDHPRRTGGEVTGRLNPGAEMARALHDDVHPKVPPGKRLHLGLGEHFDPVLADHHLGALDRHRLAVTPIHRIARQQPRQGHRRRQVVHRHDLQVEVPLADGPQQRPPSPPEPVNSDANRHTGLLP